jgi:predicted lysophospholipase L1 biosynthesis ABC-type transport system permease subunit
MTTKGHRGESELLSLTEQGHAVREECRMVLPGIQALFGFQLVVVFSPQFAEKLTIGGQRLHLLAILLIALSAALVMTPAAYHRQTDPQEITRRFLILSTRLMRIALLPLALGISADFYLIASIIAGPPLALVMAVLLLAVLATLWFVLPRLKRGGH